MVRAWITYPERSDAAPVVVVIHEIYGAEYWRSDTPRTKGYANYTEDERLYLKTFRRRMKFVDRFIPERARVLDVGCAAGYFLRVMRDRGHDAYGIEVSEAIASEAVERVGEGRIHVGTLGSVPEARQGFAHESFDLVTLWDVLEHIPDPQSLLRQARSMLKPDGCLIVETQNVDSRFATMLGPRWHHYKHQEHIYHFNPATARRLLEQSGFAIAELTSAFGGKYVSFGFIAERAQRLPRAAALALKPLGLLGRANLYVNLHDEMVIAARPAPSSEPALNAS